MRIIINTPWSHCRRVVNGHLQSSDAAPATAATNVAELTKDHFKLIREKQELLQKDSLLNAENEGRERGAPCPDCTSPRPSDAVESHWIALAVLMVHSSLS